MAEVVQSGGHGHKKGRSKHRVGVRLDMTPMVDVAFLLLTFFMLATTLLTPQIMEISLPPDSKVPVQIAESNLLTIRVRKDMTVFWNMGNEAPQRIEQKELPKILDQHLAVNSNLSTLVKMDRSVRYQIFIDMLDNIDIASAHSAVVHHLTKPEKRFSVTSMDDKDVELVQSL